MAHHTPVEADPEEIVRAQKNWHSFVKAGKLGILHVIAILGLLLLVYLNH